MQWSCLEARSSIMKKSTRISCLHMLLVIAVLANFLTLYYLAHLQQRIVSTPVLSERTQPPPDVKTKVKFPFTVLVRDFEEFENAIPDVVKSILQYFPEGKIVVVADSLPYPPLALPVSRQVKLVSVAADLNTSLADAQPGNFLKSPYLLILPDAVAGTATASTVLGKDIAEYMVNVIQKQSKIHERVRMVAWPLNGVNELKCLTLNVSLKDWTLVYNSQSMGYKYCDALQGSFALLMRTEDFLNLSAPFTRPMHASLFVQTALRHWRVHIDKKGIFKSSQELYSSPHNSWKHKSLEFGRMKQMYADFGVKLVRKDQEPEQWYGCTRETPRCFGTIINDMPEYLYRGRWTPPCCLQALRRTARHVFQKLELQGVRYWLEGGSLLGAVRHGDIIPWDYDVDIGIYQEDITKSSQLSQCWEKKIVLEDEDGFVWEHAKENEGEFFRVQYSQQNHLHIDLFPFYSRNGVMTKDTWVTGHRQDMEFPEAFLQPLTKIPFAGLEASAPNHAKEFLELKFGEGVVDRPRFPDNSTVINAGRL